jgi:predicted amidohydrolase
MIPSQSFKLALVQMRVEPGRKADNLHHATELVAQAASRGAQVIVLPEAMPLGWTDPSAMTQADEIPGGEACAVFCELARRHRVFLCSGLVERAGEQAFNAALLLGPQGEILLHHRKLNELEIGHACYAQGDRLQVAQTPLGTFGVMICSDAFARGQIVSRTLGLMGADIILSPSAWAVSADHDNAKTPYGQLWRDSYCPVARDFRLWIAGVSNVGRITSGPWQGRQCIGSSLLVDPNGEVVLQGPYGVAAEAVLCAQVTLRPRPARGEGWEKFWSNHNPSGQA